MITLLLLITYCSSKQYISDNRQNIEYLERFAQVYGYIKYFHPSDEVVKLDWDKFTIYATDKILDCKTNKEFEKAILDLFLPIAPSVQTQKTPDLSSKNFKKLKDNSVFEEIFWRHQGVGFGMSSKPPPYSSVRIRVNSQSDTIKYRPHLGESVAVKLTNNYFVIPIVTLVDKKGTVPTPDVNSFDNLVSELNSYIIDENSLAFRIGNVISVFNVFQHFFPYFEEISVDWNMKLEQAISESFLDKSKKEHINTLQEMTSVLGDGHLTIYSDDNRKDYYLLPINWEWIQGELIITYVKHKDSKLKVGDRVSKINGVLAEKYFDVIESRISAGTKGWLKHVSEQKSLEGAQNSKVDIEVNGSIFNLVRNIEPYDIEKKSIPYKKISNDIHYLNLSLIDISTFEYLIPQLKISSGIIFDLRGYPNSNGEIISYLFNKEVTTKPWMFIPITYYPDRQNQKEYLELDWNGELKPKMPYLGDKQIVFITDGSAISYSESLLGFIKGLQLGTIVGQPSAGTNGNWNTFSLPGKIKIKWTGMKVVNLDGSQLYGNGVLPDVYVERTIDGVIKGKDEFLDKSIEILK